MKSILKPVQKNRLHEEIILQIQQKIFTGELSEGEKLPPERILADSLNVNRATVREALKKLELLGLVDILHGDGIYVKDYLKSGNLDLIKDLAYGKDDTNMDILRDILEVRNIIVPEMAALAARRRSDEDLAAMERLLSDQALSVQDRDIALHAAIARAGRNLLYIFMHNFFSQMFADFGHLYFHSEENRARSQRFHEQVFRAISNRKSDEARRVTLEVLRYAEKKTLEKNNNSVI
jgi:GntR family transcriptional regulator, transcriptional repressor for pyruvate dehydrogenase complex